MKRRVGDSSALSFFFISVCLWADCGSSSGMCPTTKIEHIYIKTEEWYRTFQLNVSRRLRVTRSHAAKMLGKKFFVSNSNFKTNIRFKIGQQVS
jgi:hypothetical protein